MAHPALIRIVNHEAARSGRRGSLADQAREAIDVVLRGMQTD